MNKNATAQLHVYSAFFVLAGFVLNRGVFLLFLAEKGMSVTEIALYQALFNIATVVLELPTGLVGDFFGKKFSIQVGVLLLFFHTAGMLLLSGPFLVVLSLVEALAYSLQSGSEQALLYEIARNAGQGERFLTINARLLAAQSIATGMAIVLGSFIAQVSWSALYVCVSVFYLLQLFLLYPIERTEATRSESSEKGRFDAAKMFRRETWRVGESAFAVLLLLIGTSMLDGCCSQNSRTRTAYWSGGISLGMVSTHRLASWEFHCFSTASAAFHKVLRSAYDRGAFAGSRISLWTIPRFSG